MLQSNLIIIEDAPSKGMKLSDFYSLECITNNIGIIWQGQKDSKLPDIRLISQVLVSDIILRAN